jgi:hypothetical protein
VPDTPTTRLGLYKSLSDGSELVDYSQDIGQNLDKLDLAVGFQVVTSSTRPSAPYPGKPITESNTSYRTYFSNGTAPASGSWVEIPNSSGTFGGDLVLSGSSAIDIGGAANGGGYGVLGSSATSDVLYSKVSGDSVGRFYVSADGAHQWGSGAATRDTNLYRSAANTLKTDDDLVVAGGLTVAATTWTTYTPTVTNGGTVTWDTRTGYYYKLGKIVFVVVFLAVNAAGSGTGIVTVTMPSNVDRSTRQALTLHAETVGVNGNGASTGGTIRGGECMFFTGGSGATADRLRVDDSDGDGENNILGVDLKAGSNLTIQGWYREA